MLQRIDNRIVPQPPPEPYEKRIVWNAVLTRWARLKRWWTQYEIEVYQLDNATKVEVSPSGEESRTNIGDIRLGIADWRNRTYSNIDLPKERWRSMLQNLDDEEIRNMARPHGPEDLELNVDRGCGLIEKFVIPARHIGEVHQLLKRIRHE